ncbi:MAG: hypothetical protein N3F66_06435 [Spirochaetes bacterium]|nr:hypothetical protein [Spirochaetota bacterium]
MSTEDIIIFTKEEEDLVAQLKNAIKDKYYSEYTLIEKHTEALRSLVASISMYPSLLDPQRLSNQKRTMESLLDKLCSKSIPDMILHIPTKAILGRAFTIAKINFFIMLWYIIRDKQEYVSFLDMLLSCIASNVFMLTAEEVYTSIIEDDALSQNIRHNAAYLLARTWEHRLDYGVAEFAPILLNLWKARERLIPNFGTMMGFAELCMLSEHTSPLWLDYLQRDTITEDEVYAVEEFIFDLSYEEIVFVRDYLEKHNKMTVCREELPSILQKTHIPEYQGQDPRELYRSFRDRKINSRFRARSRLQGPKKTLEEYLMCFLLSSRTMVEY